MKTLKNCICSNGYRGFRTPDDRSLRPVSDAAQRLLVLLEVADTLTEKPELTEVDIIALDVLLAAGREHATDIIRLIAQLSGAAEDATTLPLQ
jgi:hypothetical protein